MNKISPDILNTDKVVVVAEIGKGFIQTPEERPVSEYIANAKALIDAAVYAGVDAVKFQTHELEDEQLDIQVISPHFKGSDRYSWVKRNMEATPQEFWDEVADYSKKKGILFFSTPMSRKAAQKLERMNVPWWKVGSGDVRDHVMLDYLIETKKPIIISTGMVSLSELDEVVAYITGRGAPLTVLYCVSQYPCPLEYFNLGTIEHLTEKYPHVTIGFSDHSVDSNEVDLAAVKLGAKMIEKHFSLSRELWGSDHKASVLPEEMRSLVEDIRRGAYKDVDVSKYYGDKYKEMEGATNEFRPYFNRSLMAGADVPEGAVLEKHMIYSMRPQMYAGGLPSQKFEMVVGKRLKRSLSKYDPITEDIFF